MNAGYITSTFTTIDDLAKLPKEEEDLHRLLLAIKQRAHGSRTPSPVLINEDALNSALADVALVANTVSSASDSDLLESLAVFDAVQSLINNHTDLEPFAALLRALHHKKQALIDAHTVSKAQELLHRLEKVDISPETDEILLAVAREAPVADPLSDVSRQCAATIEAAITEKVNLKRSALESDLSSSLDTINWLSPDFDVTAIPHATQINIRAIFDRLLTVQSSTNSLPQYPETWWAVRVVIAPLTARFNYHFASANNKTNKSSKPEWALEYAESCLAENLRSILWLIGDSLTKWNYVAEFEVITAVLAPLRLKFLAEINAINSLIRRDSTAEKSGRLLSHLVYEVAAFDQRIKTRYMFDPWYRIPNELAGDTLSKDDENAKVAASSKLNGETWAGLNSELLLDQDEQGVINWLSFERELARKRFDTEILGAADAFTVDLDYRESHDSEDSTLPPFVDTATGFLHPTYSAYNLVKLFANLISHFQAVGSVKYQLKYVSSIQLQLIEDYYDTLASMNRRFADTHYTAAMISLIPGALHAKDKSKDIEDTKSGLEALEMLIGIYCLARFLSNKMQEWSMELIFIQLFEFYRNNVSDADDAESLFDDDINRYSALADSAMNLVHSFFRTQIKSALKLYVNLSTWDDTANHEQESSKNLSPLVNLVSAYTVPFRRAMSTAEYLVVANGALTSICRILLEYVVTNNRFSKAGVAQLQADAEFVFSELAALLQMGPTESLLSTKGNPAFKKLNQLIEVLKFVSEQDYSDKEWDDFVDRQDLLSSSQIRDLKLRVVL